MDTSVQFPGASSPQKSLIVYGSPERLTVSHQKLSRRDYYVRTDVVDGDVVSALAQAKPMRGETVLNTVEVL